MAKASALAMRKPTSASMNVTANCTASDRSTVAAIAVGDGNRYSGISPITTIACQATSSASPNASGVSARDVIGRPSPKRESAR